MLKTNSIAVKTFDALSKNELYSIIALRMAVFCVEQNCPYQDLDNQDQEALHVFIKDQENIVVYARIIKQNSRCSLIGRVVVAPEYRKRGLANKTMLHCIKIIKQNKGQRIELSAQSYLKGFYQSLGFINTGRYYLEDDIPHEHMYLDINPQ